MYTRRRECFRRLSPIATPFDARGDVDRAALQSNIARWLTSGIRGIVALGSNGEAPLLDDSESTPSSKLRGRSFHATGC